MDLCIVENEKWQGMSIPTIRAMPFSILIREKRFDDHRDKMIRIFYLVNEVGLYCPTITTNPLMLSWEDDSRFLKINILDNTYRIGYLYGDQRQGNCSRYQKHDYANLSDFLFAKFRDRCSA